MREEFFPKISWTRSFISGPADPLHNPRVVWCHICKKKISIRTKGTFEILRHHRSEKHLRRDQRWRYEHLRSIDTISGKVQHRVRGRNGKVLTKIELAKELPKFIHAELVDIRERFPFYDDFIKGSPTALKLKSASFLTTYKHTETCLYSVICGRGSVPSRTTKLHFVISTGGKNALL